MVPPVVMRTTCADGFTVEIVPHRHFGMMVE